MAECLTFDKSVLEFYKIVGGSTKVLQKYLEWLWNSVHGHHATVVISWGVAGGWGLDLTIFGGKMSLLLRFKRIKTHGVDNVFSFENGSRGTNHLKDIHHVSN